MTRVTRERAFILLVLTAGIAMLLGRFAYIVPVMAIAGKVPGVKDAIQKFGMGPVQEYITRVGTDAVIAGSANVLQGVATEQINRAAGAEPSPYNVAENFLAGAGTAGLIRGVGELASGKRPANVQQASVERPPIRSGPELPTLEQVDTEVGGLLKQQIAERVAAQTPKPPVSRPTPQPPAPAPPRPSLISSPPRWRRSREPWRRPRSPPRSRRGRPRTASPWAPC